eukprot:6158906-Pyramimonas_sp.AAC.1
MRCTYGEPRVEQFSSNMFRCRSKFGRRLRRFAGFGTPKGSGGGGISLGPFRWIVWGCLKRFGHFLSHHVSLSDQIWRMSQAIR